VNNFRELDRFRDAGVAEMKICCFALAVAAMLPAVAAYGDTFQFVYTPNLSFVYTPTPSLTKYNTFSFTIDMSTTPIDNLGADFSVGPLPITFDGVTQSGSLFFLPCAGPSVPTTTCGFGVTVGSVSQNMHADAFDSDASAPMFYVGTFFATEQDPTGIRTLGEGSLAVTDLSTPALAPEPGTGALLAAGILAAAGVWRRRLRSF
jgi:PEP-CTERM motif